MSRTMGENRTTQRHIIVEFQDTWDKAYLQNFQREKKISYFQRLRIRMSSDLSVAAQKARKQWRNTFEEVKLF